MTAVSVYGVTYIERIRRLRPLAAILAARSSSKWLPVEAHSTRQPIRSPLAPLAHIITPRQPRPFLVLLSLGMS